MSRLLLPLIASVLCLGCTDTAADVETGDPFAGAPDLTGVYDVSLSDVTGCDGVTAAQSWVGTELTISGEASALDFTFEGGMVPGTVDPSSAWEFGGALTVEAVELTIAATGVASEDADEVLLDGTVDVTAATADDTCTLGAVLLATRKDG